MRIPSPGLLFALHLASVTAPSALAGDALVLGFEGSASAEGVPPPWRYERWSPVVGFGAYTAEASIVSPSGAGAPTGRVLRIACQEAGFMVASERNIDLQQHRWARWRWRADTVPTGASFRARETNDQVLQLLFGFEGGEILGYIWDSTGTVGATGSGLSWREDVRVMVLQVGPGGWASEQRDLVADFELLFGHLPPGPLQGLAIQSNCQHTESTGLGFIGPIQLSAR
jgi:hypothetical protein